MRSRERAFRVYWALRRLLVPRLEHAQARYERVLDACVRPGAVWLDVGCGHHLLPLWREHAERALIARAALVVGLDVDLPSLRAHRSVRDRVRGELGALPFAADAFDLVSANMVVEHLDDPARQMREICRVLRPGGRLVFHTPNRRGYLTRLARLVPAPAKRWLIRLLDGRRAHDVFPTHYRANTAEDIERIAGASGLRVVHVHHVATDAAFSVVAPLAALELLVIRALLGRRLRRYRTNLVAVLERAV